MVKKGAIRAEHLWWLGIVLWGAAVIFWTPVARPTLVDAPSASPYPPGHAVFYELVKSEAKGARRLLEGPSNLPPEVGALAVLAPRQSLPPQDREEMLTWVDETGGTLIIGHPILDGERESLDQFSADQSSPLCPLRFLEEGRPSSLDCVGSPELQKREVPTFNHELRRIIDADECEPVILLMNELNEAVATVESCGSGRVIQLVQADLLDNEAIATKHTHLFAAALIDEVGRDKEWAFDEAHEGVRPEPKLIEVVGASDYRPLFLQALLLLLLIYWRATARLGIPRASRDNGGVREVATAARDMGDFYLRAGKSRWALSRSLEYLKLAAKQRGAASEAKKKAVELSAQAEAELNKEIDHVDKHAWIIRKIAECQSALHPAKKRTRFTLR